VGKDVEVGVVMELEVPTAVGGMGWISQDSATQQMIQFAVLQTWLLLEDPYQSLTLDSVGQLLLIVGFVLHFVVCAYIWA
jgi:hypothetical protein